MEAVAANIRAEAARQGLHQKDLARLVGMGRSAVNVRWHGQRQWQLEDISRVANVLGVTPAWLCQQPDTPMPNRWRPRQDSNLQPTVYRPAAGQRPAPAAHPDHLAPVTGPLATPETAAEVIALGTLIPFPAGRR